MGNVFFRLVVGLAELLDLPQRALLIGAHMLNLRNKKRKRPKCATDGRVREIYREMVGTLTSSREKRMEIRELCGPFCS